MSEALASTVVASGGPTSEAPAGSEATVDETHVARPLASPGDTLASGTTVDRYVLGERLGLGGMGVVYRARDPRLDRDVAIKLVAVSDLAGSQQRVAREAQTMAKLTHPNTCTVHDTGVWHGRLYIAMELFSGGTLTAWLRTRRPWREILAKLLEAGRGLAAAHASGIVHRDFKPDNVLLADDGRAVVTDFGLARSVHEPSEIAGTPAYMPPEQLVGGDANAACDQYAFAVSCWQALCGCLPYQAEPGPTVRDVEAVCAAMLRAVQAGRVCTTETAVPARVRRVLRRGFAADRDLRWPSMSDMLGQLERAARPRGRRIAIASAVIAVVGGAVACAVLWPDPGVPLYPPGPPAPALAPLYAARARAAPDLETRLRIYSEGYRRTDTLELLHDAARDALAAYAAIISHGDSADCAVLPVVNAYELRAGPSADPALADASSGLRARCNLAPLDELELQSSNEDPNATWLAIDATKELLRLRPDRVALYRRLAELYLQVGDCINARLALQDVEMRAANGAGLREEHEAALARCETSR